MDQMHQNLKKFEALKEAASKCTSLAIITKVWLLLKLS